MLLKPTAGAPAATELAPAARRRLKQNKKGKPKRDEYMRQMIDTKGVLNRLAINADETERGIIEEFEENQYESREAVKYAGAPALGRRPAQTLRAAACPLRAAGQHAAWPASECAKQDRGAREVRSSL